mmetsp:Transcript_112522/g.350734  ORF Transcript_112522/g.350734 Transcript_112522/m.350734 type:complete len:282 (-) Transcript_112522:768-1613(-)
MHHAAAGRPRLMAMPTVPPATPRALPAEANTYPIAALARTCTVPNAPRPSQWPCSPCILCKRPDLAEERSRCRKVKTGTRARLTATSMALAACDNQSSSNDTRMLGSTVAPYWAYAAKPAMEYKATHVIRAKSADRMICWRDSTDISLEIARTLISTPKHALERAMHQGTVPVSLTDCTEVSMVPPATARPTMSPTRPMHARKPKETNLCSNTSVFAAAGNAQTATMRRPTWSLLSAGSMVGTTSPMIVQHELDTRKIVAFNVRKVNMSPMGPRCLLMTPW